MQDRTNIRPMVRDEETGKMKSSRLVLTLFPYRISHLIAISPPSVRNFHVSMRTLSTPVAMALLVTAFSLFTDALRDALDPKLK